MFHTDVFTPTPEDAEFLEEDGLELKTESGNSENSLRELSSLKSQKELED
jgi:hypothetical protein